MSADRWSSRISDRYRCELLPQLADWFDCEIWRQHGRAEFREPLHPDSLLSAAPESIWPGLMTCDLIPIISNTAGDWLCGRVDRDNVVSEVVQWYHGGGDWIPWGADLAEAIAFDAVAPRLAASSRRHAVPAEDPRLEHQADSPEHDEMLGWALGHLPDLRPALVEPSADPGGLASSLLDLHVSEIAVRCELVLESLTQSTHPIVSALESVLEGDPSINRANSAQWRFDVDRIPLSIRDQIEPQVDVSFDVAQDWRNAAEHARCVTKIAPHLGWGWDIVGYAAERQGEIDDAINAYRRATTCSVFTDQSIRLRTHWASDQAAKFSAARLMMLDPDSITESDYLGMLCDPDVNARRRQITDHWLEQGAVYQAEGNFAKALQCFTAAGWDVGTEPIGRYAELLERIAEMAQRSEQTGRAEVAMTHRRCLHHRYGI